MRTFNFHTAIDKFSEGKCLARYSWLGTEKRFVFKQVPSIIDKNIVPNMTSVPQKVKEYFYATFQSPMEQIQSIYYRNQLALVNVSNSIDSYSASADDIFASDWYEYEFKEIQPCSEKN